MGLSFLLAFHQTMIYIKQIQKWQQKMQIHEQYTTGNRNNYFFAGTFLKKNFRISALNSFQQSGISSPFSRFIIAIEICFCGLRQSMKSASLIFLFLQCGSESRNLIFSQSISWLDFATCWAMPLVED